MTESESKESTESQEQTKAEKVTFSEAQQMEINRIIADRLAQERKSQESKEAERKKQAEIEKLSGEEKLKAQHQAELDKLTAERDEAIKNNRMLKAGEELAKFGISTDLARYVVDGDESKIIENVKELDRLINANVEKRVQSNLSHGAPKVTENRPSNSMLDDMRKVAGLKPSA